jgi:hypothetical protein
LSITTTGLRMWAPHLHISNVAMRAAQGIVAVHHNASLAPHASIPTAHLRSQQAQYFEMMDIDRQIHSQATVHPCKNDHLIFNDASVVLAQLLVEDVRPPKTHSFGNAPFKPVNVSRPTWRRTTSACNLRKTQ